MKRARVLAALALIGALTSTPISTATAAPPVRRAAPKPAPKPTPGAPRPAPAADPTPTGIEVTVTETAGSRAYLTPGESGGVRRGAKLVVRGRELTVAGTTGGFATVEDPDHVLHDGDHARVSLVAEQVEAARELPPPRPESAFAGVWPEPEPPATSQHPAPVPLGEAARDRRYDVKLTVASGGVAPLDARGNLVARTALEARVHAAPFRVPLAFDLDGAVQRWVGPGLDDRDGSGARSLWRVRELMLSYGDGARSWAGLGRLRYAASTLGTLDGLRVQTPVAGGLRAAAFGGVLPDPTNGAPALEAQRFGAELAYSAPESPLRPEAALVLNGSTFQGSLDERRMSAVASIFPGRSRVGGHVEVSSFAGDNPWGASAIELTKAGGDASLRFGPLSLGARVDLRQPERSRWLASYLPPSFFCLAAPQTAPGAEPCDGRVGSRLLGAGDASIELGDHVVVAAGATVVRDVGIARLPATTGGFASVRAVRLARIFRADLTGAYAAATYLQTTTIAGGPGVTLLGDRLDVGAYYRFATLSYRADGASLEQHGGGATATVLVGSELTFTGQSELTTGPDVKALVFFASATWRPRL